MEFKDKYKALQEIFEVKDGEGFSEAIMRIVTNPGVSEYYDKYCDLLPDLQKDELRSCWQFWHADREEKKQDYTSDSLADIVAFLLEPKDGDVVYDCCSGSGSLALGVWRLCKNITIISEELDASVIPLQLFNYAVRNMSAIVRRCNVLTRECEEQYEVIPGSKYASIQKSMFPDIALECTKSISNPPFNLKQNGKLLNYAFVNQCMDNSMRGVFILPTGVLTQRQEREQRADLIEKGILSAVVTMPGGLFESTGVNVSILVCDKANRKDGVVIVDAESLSDEEIRYQRGEGDKAHTERIYQKKMRVFKAEQIQALSMIIKEKRETEISTFVSIDKIREASYSLMRGIYMSFEPDEEYATHRSYNDIIHEINLIGRARNSFKITVNKVWASQLGLVELLEMEQQNNEAINLLNDSLKTLGIEERVIASDYISQTNSKELVIRQMDKETLSPVMVSFLPLLKQHIMTMNIFENILLVELRDSLLPALMSGRINMTSE